MELKFVEISDIADDLLLPWLDLYETSFPPVERVLVSDHLRVLKNKAQGLSRDQYLMGGLDESGNLVAMMRFSLCIEERVALLWYIAVSPDARNLGFGARCYAEVKRIAIEFGARMVIFEVERPEDFADPSLREIAQRRIEFYRRQGAELMLGVSYIMSVGPHQPEIPMHIMVDAYETLSSNEIIEVAESIFGERLRRTGAIVME